MELAEKMGFILNFRKWIKKCWGVKIHFVIDWFHVWLIYLPCNIIMYHGTKNWYDLFLWMCTTIVVYQHYWTNCVILYTWNMYVCESLHGMRDFGNSLEVPMDFTTHFSIDCIYMFYVYVCLHTLARKILWIVWLKVHYKMLSKW